LDNKSIEILPIVKKENITVPTQTDSTAEDQTKEYLLKTKNETEVKTTLKRQITWKFGLEPLPNDYEAKLMGRIRIKKDEWRTQGLPGPQSMPGYIYDDGVLVETRC